LETGLRHSKKRTPRKVLATMIPEPDECEVGTEVICAARKSTLLAPSSIKCVRLGRPSRADENSPPVPKAVDHKINLVRSVED
jgi:hypothetical protein